MLGFNKKKDDDSMLGLLVLANALGGGGNKDSIIPEDDIYDMHRGAQSIPSEVTDARRRGKTVRYINPTESLPNGEWIMPDGKRVS